MATSIRALEPHEQRVVEEEQQLADRHQKLSAFIGSPSFFKIDPADSELLVQQEVAMGQYLAILRRRIARFAAPATIGA